MGYDRYKEVTQKRGRMYYPTYGEHGYAPLEGGGEEFCCCFTSEDIDTALTCPEGGGPAVLQCVTIGNGHLVRVICGVTIYDFFTDPDDGPGGTPVCQGPNDAGPVEITVEKYNELFAAQAVACPTFIP